MKHYADVVMDIEPEKLKLLEDINFNGLNILLQMPKCEWKPNLRQFARALDMPESTLFDKMTRLQKNFELQLIVRLKNGKHS